MVNQQKHRQSHAEFAVQLIREKIKPRFQFSSKDDHTAFQENFRTKQSVKRKSQSQSATKNRQEQKSVLYKAISPSQ